MKREKVEKLRKKKTTILTLTITGLLFVITGIAYSIFYADLKGIRENTINSNTLIFEYEEPTNELMLEGNQGIKDEDGIKQEKYFEFTVTGKSNGEQDVPYYVYIEKLGVENEIPEEKIKYYLTKVEEQETGVAGVELLSEVAGTTRKVIYTTTMELNNNEVEHRYRLRLWLDETYDIKDLVETGENSNGEQTAILKEHKYKYRVNISTREPSNLASDWKDYTEDEYNYIALYTLNTKELPATKEYNGVTYTKSSEVDVSEQQNDSVMLGTYIDTSGNKIAIIGQNGGVVAPGDSSYLFGTSDSSTTISYQHLDLSNLDTSKVTNMGYMFQYCSGLTNLDVSMFDTSNVITMAFMFCDCENLVSINLDGFNTKKLESMTYMFGRCRNLQSLDLSGFDTSNVTTMNATFNGCNSLMEIDLTSFNTSKVTNMRYMFQFNAFTHLDLTSFDTSNVTNMEGMFWGTSKALEVKVGCGWNTSNVTNLTGMFGNSGVSEVTKVCSSLASDWKDYTEDEYNYIALYTLNTKELPTTKKYNGVTYTKSSEVDVSSLQDNAVMLGTYIDTSGNKIAIMGQDGGVVAPENSEHLFGYLDTTGTTAYQYMDLSNLDTSNAVDMRAMFYYCDDLTSLDLSNFDTRSATIMGGMFEGCYNLESLNVSSFNTSKVTQMQFMFRYLRNLKTINVSNFDTSNVTDMRYMFGQSPGLTKLDLSNFDTSNVTDMRSMFRASTSLTEIKVGCNWNTTQADTTGMLANAGVSSVTQICLPEANLASTWKNYTEDETNYLALYTLDTITLPETKEYNGVTYTKSSEVDVSEQQNGKVLLGTYADTSGNKIAILAQENGVLAPVNSMSLFFNMSNLTYIDLSNFDTSDVSSMRSMFNGCSSLTSLDLTSFDTNKVTTMYGMFYNCTNLQSVNLTSFDTRNVNTMEIMFSGCQSLTSIDLTNFDTRNVTNMHSVFANCRVATEIKLGNKFNTSKVTNMYGMFTNCFKLQSLDVSMFDTRNVTNMAYMFEECKAIKTLDITNFDTSNVTDMRYMFAWNPNLIEVKVGCKWTTENADASTILSGAGTSTVTQICNN